MTSDHFMTLDETVRAIKAEYEEKLTAMKDKLMAAEIEATMAKDQMKQAILAKEDAIQVASRLIAHFDMAEKCFAEGKRFALTFAQPSVPLTHHGAPISKTSLEALGYNTEPGGMTVVDKADAAIEEALHANS